MSSTSIIEIDRLALESNIRFLDDLLGSQTRLSVVVKGNAYGHGVSLMLPVLQDLGVDHFSVYSSPEARKARNFLSDGSTLMIMGFIYPEDYEWIIREEVEFYVSSLNDLYLALESAKKTGKKARIHVEFETGMNRTGLLLPEVKQAIAIVKSNPRHLDVKGFASHLAGAESIANYTRIKSQVRRFKRRMQLMQDFDIHAEVRHLASSAATVIYPGTRFNLVRVGIITYGYWPTRETFIHYFHRKKDKTDPLKRALSWKSSVMSVKSVRMGDFVGYGLSYQAPQDMKIMIIPVGYCNGYSRSLSNNGHVLVRGQNAPVISTVNMNMIISDVSHIEDVRVGDEVVLIGNQSDSEITFSSFAEMNNSLNYEILARLPGNIERRLTGDEVA
jgi:alanine racemase